MERIPCYELDPCLRTLDTQVLRAWVEEGQSWAVLEDTVLYPEGGGQPCDRGTANGIEVLEVRSHAGELRHRLAAPLAEGPVALVLDWARRFDHMQQHTGQHLLTALAQDRFGWPTMAFHLGEEVSDVELAVPTLSLGDRARLEEAIAAEIRAARPVRARRVDAEGYARETVRSRGLPEGHVGDIRLVEIAGVDLNTCGGTHLQHTGELESLALLGTEPLRGGLRLFFVAGGRVRRRLATHEARTAALRSLLGAPDAELVATLQGKLDQLLGADKRLRRTEEELAEARAEGLAAAPGVLSEVHLGERDMAFLQRLARQVLAAAPAKVVFLTAEAAGQGIFLLSAGPEATLDIPTLGRGVAEALGAKGGGSGKSFQGKAPDLAGRARALALLQG
ncbi:MAG: alanyl-tRNA editing protein [Holophagaceae bacterium]